MRTGTSGLWLVVYMTHSLPALEAAERMLQDEGFLVRRRALRRSVSGGAYELCVLESEAQEARQLIMERGF